MIYDNDADDDDRSSFHSYVKETSIKTYDDDDDGDTNFLQNLPFFTLFYQYDTPTLPLRVFCIYKSINSSRLAHSPTPLPMALSLTPLSIHSPHESPSYNSGALEDNFTLPS